MSELITTTVDPKPRSGTSWHRLLGQLAKFALVGGIGFVVDVAVFNALLGTMHTSGWPLAAKTISTILAIVVNWLGNRFWTFRHRVGASAQQRSTFKEGFEFFVASLVGSGVSLICLGISHYVLNLTSALADNISANVVGLLLGSVVRFVAYRWWVFADR